VSPDGADARVAELRARLGRLERAATRRRRQVARLATQVEVLGEEARSPLDRTVGGAEDPELAPGTPSFSLAAQLHRRAHLTHLFEREGAPEPVLLIAPKLPAQRWAALNGVRVPRVLGRWPDPGAVEWDALPARFVLKADVGGGAVNVFPLARDTTAGGYTDLLTGEPTTRAAVTDALWSRHHDSSRYFAEELLVGRGGDASTVPDDIKVFCFYGEPVYLEARRGDQARAAAVTSPRARFFTAEGTELTDVRPFMDPGDDVVARPEDVEGVVAAAAALSGAVRRPLVRLDFYETEHGVVFGELTMSPGHVPFLVPEWDLRLGTAYEQAYARLLRDVAAEGALHVVLGEDPGDEG
jgi:hypothetical protein